MQIKDNFEVELDDIESNLPHGEKNLILGILALAVNDLKNKKDPKIRDGAKNWFLAKEESDYIFSFVSICRLLDISPAFLRKKIGLFLD